MADNFSFTEGSGKTGAADDVSGVLYPRVKLSHGPDGSATDVSTASPLPTQLRDSDGTDVALSAKLGALTETPPASDTASSGLNGRLQRIAQRITSLIALFPAALGQTTKSGSMAVTVASDDDLQAKLGSITETAPASDTASSGLNGRLQRIAQRLTTLIGLLPTALGANGGLKIEGVASGTAVPVSIASVPSHAVTNAGTFAVQESGGALTALQLLDDTVFTDDAAFTPGTSKVNAVGLIADSTSTDSVDEGDIGIPRMTLDRRQIVQPYEDLANAVSGAITSAMTGTTSTSLVAAPGAGLRNYITTIIVSNSHATVGTDIIIQDGLGGTTLLTIPAAAAYGGAVIPLPMPLRQPTANTALYCANVTTGASTKVSAVGFKAV